MCVCVAVHMCCMSILCLFPFVFFMPCTKVVENEVVKVRSKEKDGYTALQIGAFNHPKAHKVSMCFCVCASVYVLLCVYWSTLVYRYLKQFLGSLKKLESCQNANLQSLESQRILHYLSVQRSPLLIL